MSSFLYYKIFFQVLHILKSQRNLELDIQGYTTQKGAIGQYGMPPLLLFHYRSIALEMTTL